MSKYKDHKILYPLFRSEIIYYISHYDKDALNVKLKTGKVLTFRAVPRTTFNRWALSDDFDTFYLANIKKVYHYRERDFILEKAINQMVKRFR
jgi:hypothetical protein